MNLHTYEYFETMNHILVFVENLMKSTLTLVEIYCSHFFLTTDASSILKNITVKPQSNCGVREFYIYKRGLPYNV